MTKVILSGHSDRSRDKVGQYGLEGEHLTSGRPSLKPACARVRALSSCRRLIVGAESIG